MPTTERLSRRDDPIPGRRRAVRQAGPVRRVAALAHRLTHDLRLWSTLAVVMMVLLALARTEQALPRPLTETAVLASTTVLSVWLSVRAGGSPFLGGALALVIGGAALATGAEVLQAGAAVAVATVAAVLALLATSPAARFGGVVREYVVALGVGILGALTAAGYDAPVAQQRAHYLVLTFALLSTFALVYKLGAGLHGLGRRGVVMVVSGTVLLFVVVAYTQALAAWGGDDIRSWTTAFVDSIRETLGAVPRPGQFLLGFPALVWGISQRARRRQGWWFCAFGVVGLAGVTSRLLDPATDLSEASLGLAYNAVIGLCLGYLVIRADAFLTGNRGRGARRAEEGRAHRPEPARLAPLM